jgi:hypothetical protein
MNEVERSTYCPRDPCLRVVRNSQPLYYGRHTAISERIPGGLLYLAASIFKPVSPSLILYDGLSMAFGTVLGFSLFSVITKRFSKSLPETTPADRAAPSSIPFSPAWVSSAAVCTVLFIISSATASASGEPPFVRAKPETQSFFPCNYVTRVLIYPVNRTLQLANFFQCNTSGKSLYNPSKINTYKSLDLKSFGMNTCKKTGGFPLPLAPRPLQCYPLSSNPVPVATKRSRFS